MSEATFARLPSARIILCPELSKALQTSSTLTPDRLAAMIITDEHLQPVTCLRRSDAIATCSGYFSPSQPDQRCWALVPLSSLAQAWHDYRYALGHHLFGHPPPHMTNKQEMRPDAA